MPVNSKRYQRAEISFGGAHSPYCVLEEGSKGIEIWFSGGDTPSKILTSVEFDEWAKAVSDFNAERKKHG